MAGFNFGRPSDRDGRYLALKEKKDRKIKREKKTAKYKKYLHSDRYAQRKHLAAVIFTGQRIPQRLLKPSGQCINLECRTFASDADAAAFILMGAAVMDWPALGRRRAKVRRRPAPESRRVAASHAAPVATLTLRPLGTRGATGSESSLNASNGFFPSSPPKSAARRA